MICPDPQSLADFVDEALGARRYHIVEKHLRECGDCRLVLQSLRIESELLRLALGEKKAGAQLADRILGKLFRDDSEKP